MSQKSAFLDGEANAYYLRNAKTYSAPQPDRLDIPKFFAEYVQAGQRVLEIGCSSGNNVAWIASERRCEAAGIDPSPAAVAAGRKSFPAVDLRIGTSEELPFAAQAFNMVLFGFCLCWVDRDLLYKSVAEADRVLAPGGFLGIWDFDPPQPMRREYHHRPGLWSYKMDYSTLFLANPAYVLVKKMAFSHHGMQLTETPGDRLGAWLLHKGPNGYGEDRH